MEAIQYYDCKGLVEKNFVTAKRNDFSDLESCRRLNGISFQISGPLYLIAYFVICTLQNDR